MKRRSLLYSILILFTILSTRTAFVHSTDASLHYSSNKPSLHLLADLSVDKFIGFDEKSETFFDDLIQREYDFRPAFGFSGGSIERIDILLQNGTSQEDHIVDIIFRPANGKTISDYIITMSSSNTAILTQSDIQQVSVVEDNYQSKIIAYNMTYSFNFDKSPGIVNFIITATVRATQEVFSVKVIPFLVAGIAIFDPNGQIVTGDSRGINRNQYSVIDITLQYTTFIQYFDGTNSTEILRVNPPALQTLEGTAPDNQGLLFHLNNCTAQDGTWNGNLVSVNPNCGFAFAYGRETVPYTGLKFAIRLNRYRRSSTTIVFRWPGFTTGSPFDGEVYMNVIKIDILGPAPPPVYKSYSPVMEYSRSGGELITLTMFNLNQLSTYWKMTVENRTDGGLPPYPTSFLPAQSPPTVTDTGYPYFYQIIVLETITGSGTNLGFTITVTRNLGLGPQNVNAVLDSTLRTFSYETTPYVIDAILPNNSPVQGNIVAVLQGFFRGFDPANGDHVSFSSYIIPISNVRNFTDTTITFVVPPLSETCAQSFQSCQIFAYTVEARIGGFTALGSSGPILFDYHAVQSVSIRVFGDASSTDNIYTFDQCTNMLFKAALGPGMNQQNPIFQWKVFDTIGVDILPNMGIPMDQPTLRVPYGELEIGRSYIVVIEVSSDYSIESVEATVEVIRSGINAVGVTLYKVPERSICVPDISLKLSALVVMPACLEIDLSTAQVEYLWSYRGISYPFFPGITEPKTLDEIGPVRLGREFNIPNSLLSYGTQAISLRVTVNNNIIGSSTTTFSINSATLVAQINTAAVSSRVSGAQSFVMTGTNSFDPDTRSNTAMTYRWTCTWSWNPLFVNSNDPSIERTACRNDLFPSGREAQTFTVSAQTITSYQDPNRVRYIKYTLVVSKPNPARSSPVTYYTLEVQTASFRIPRVGSISFSNGVKGLMRTALEFYGDIIVNVDNPTGVWEYILDDPRTGRNLLTVDNLIALPGFYTAGSITTRFPLGLNPNTLEPNTQYKLIIIFTDDSPVQQVQEINIRTIAAPRILQLDVDGGSETQTLGGVTMLTVFTVDAQLNFDSANFKIFFFLRNSATGITWCTSACNGENPGTFRIPTQGDYILTAVLYDAQGLVQLDTVTYEKRFQIIEGIEDQPNPIVTVNTEYTLGNDASYVDFISGLLADGTASQQTVTIQTQSTKFLALIESSVISSQLGQKYMDTAIQMAEYGAITPLTEPQVIEILRMPLETIVRTPSTESMQLGSKFAPFYNFSLSTVLNYQSGGSSKRRLAQTTDTVNQLTLDWAESQKEAFYVGTLRDVVCGSLRQATTAISGGIRTTGVQPVSYSMGMVCNMDQASSFSIDGLNSKIPATFSFCSSVYTATQARKAIGVSTFPDYVTMSNIQPESAATATEGLVVTTVGVIAGNQFVPDTSRDDLCYVVSSPIQRETLNNAPNNVGSGFTYDNIKSDFTPIETGYNRNFEQLITDIEIVQYLSSIQSARTGTFGLSLGQGVVVASPFAHEEPRKSNLSGFEITFIVMGILIFVALTLLASWLAATRCCLVKPLLAAPVDQCDTYVDRDIYGRGYMYDSESGEGEDYEYFGYEQNYEVAKGLEDK